MTENPPTQPPGWYYAQGDPQGTQRYWDGVAWQGGPQAVPGAESAGGTSGVYTKDTLPSPWVRLLARIIDGLILIIPALIIGAIVGGTAGGVGGFSASAVSTDGGTIVASILVGIIGLAYEYYFLAKDGATPGKKIMSIKVVLEDGSPLGSDGAIRRLILSAAGIVPIIGGIIGFVVGIGTVIMIFTDDRRQVPADKVAKSLVIKA
jgi:uncharacterized RDD family membrane protein YckC